MVGHPEREQNGDGPLGRRKDRVWNPAGCSPPPPSFLVPVAPPTFPAELWFYEPELWLRRSRRSGLASAVALLRSRPE